MENGKWNLEIKIRIGIAKDILRNHKNNNNNNRKRKKIYIRIWIQRKEF